MAKRLTIYGVFHDSCADEIIERSIVISKAPLTPSDKRDILNKTFNKCWFCSKPILESEVK